MLNTNFDNAIQYHRVMNGAHADLNRAITKRNWEIAGLASSVALTAIAMSSTIILASVSILLPAITTSFVVVGIVGAIATVVGLGSIIKLTGSVRFSNRKVAQIRDLQQNIQRRGHERRNAGGREGQGFERCTSEQERIQDNQRRYQENLRDHYKPINTVPAQSTIMELNSDWGIGKSIFSEIDKDAVLAFKENIAKFRDQSKSMASCIEKVHLFESIMGVENVALENLEKLLSWIEVDSENELILKTPPEELADDKILNQCICPVELEYPKTPLVEMSGEASYFYDVSTIKKLPEPKISPMNRQPFIGKHRLMKFPDLTWIIQFRLFQKAILKID